ncbi:hypothetical protein QN386_11555 [Pseudomonas sp. CCI3.2]|uniref:hypothetical protein n=1 Tax=unclassified Pseudomonas TaxID=196821 RepID=UPI002AC9E366|nr:MULTISPECIES: hypothetical protein [unclassified Pseudomonas]MEB0075515.1 hypothetical protein [Pseudomonas sp. MH10out]MEB0091094.1 hypothetical protein [Pseudomonas sp. CCI4.2]MEB0101951.1 hypothetical protein [Pseudomonas sp. CCI3.2]MEB0130450.1 hypothetical protein [Pseudomonas sp. CCI2.4]MEB0158540.1 hypothetical protein [Pseudomonas sp. AH2 (2023)]
MNILLPVEDAGVFGAALARSKLGGPLWGLKLQRVRTEAFPNKFGPTDSGDAHVL